MTLFYVAFQSASLEYCFMSETSFIHFRCIPEKEELKDIPGMVHGTCECDHNTK